MASAHALRILHLCSILFLLSSLPAQAASPRLVIEGGGDRLQENIRSFIALTDEPCNTPLWRLRARLRGLDKRVEKAGQALGYYRMSWERQLERDEDCWTLRLNLTPGEPVRLDQVNLSLAGEGAEDSAFQKLLKTFDLREGDPLNHGVYESAKAQFAPLASARGYFEGRFDQARIQVAQDRKTARLDLVYNTGPRYRFGEIHVNAEALDPEFIRRYLPFETGDLYDMDLLLEFKNRLSSSDYFSRATVRPLLQALDQQRVPVSVETQARKRHSYSLGVGFATDTGPRLLLGYENRYLNRRGHRFEANAQFAELGTQLEAAYKLPMHFPAHESLRLSTGYQTENTDDTRSDLITLGSDYARSRPGSDWLQNYSLSYRREEFSVAGQAGRSSNLVLPAVSWSRTESDGGNYPRSGWGIFGRVSGTSSALGSDINFAQVYGRGKWIQSLGPVRALLRLEAGASQVGGFSRLPVSQRFFAGGDSSVRGYDFKALGPTTLDPETGEQRVVGGNHLLVQSVELDARIKGNWALAAFYDQGNAFDNNEFDLKRGAGLGLRWISPIGPIRIDIARALDEPRGFRLHLSMGPDL